MPRPAPSAEQQAKMRDGAARRRAAIAAAEAQLRAARAPYLAAADEVLDLRGREGMRDRELAAWRRMITLHGPVAAARRKLDAARATKR